MNFLVFVVCLMGFSVIGNAQESAKKTTAPAGSGLKLPNATLPSAPSSVLEKPSDLFNKPFPTSGSLLQKEKNLNFANPKVFANSGLPYQEKLNKTALKGESIYDVDIKGNQNMGDVRTKSKIVRLMYRDYDQVDNDMIRVYVNGNVAMPYVILGADLEGFDVILDQRENVIEFEALNEGEGPPNTAQFEMYDEKGQLIFSNQWAISTGYKARVTVYKDY